MIRLTKYPLPQILEEKQVEWTLEYLRFKATPKLVPKAAATRYRDPEIKKALVAESFGKCVYCESKISHAQRGDTEHILPVSRCPELVVEWQNLAFVCRSCNEAKSDYYSLAEPLINPFVDEPANHIKFFGPFVSQIPGDDKGFRTINQLSLCRMQLLEQRIESIRFVQAMLDHWASKPDGETKNIYRRAILALAQPPAEYSATVRDYLYQAVGWTDFVI